MIFLSNAEGVITAAIPEPINQGSVGVNRIVLIAPFPSTSVVSATFTLPNGIKIYPRYVGKEQEENYQYLMGVVEAFINKRLEIDGVTVNAWQLTLDKAITQVAGNVKVQFLVTSAYATGDFEDPGNGEYVTTDVQVSKGQVLSTTPVTLPINRGNAYLAPSVSVDDLDTIEEYLSAALQAQKNAEKALADINETIGDAISDATNQAVAEATAAANGAADRAEAQANRASPWSLVATQANIYTVLQGLSSITAKSILFLNVDFANLDLNNYVVDNVITFVFHSSCKKVEFRGCNFGTRVVSLQYPTMGDDTYITGVNGGNVRIVRFLHVEDCICDSIFYADSVINCNCHSVLSCDNITGTKATVFSSCNRISASEGTTFTNCKFVDPYSVKGFVPVIDNGKVPTLSQSGGYVPKQLPAKIVLAVDDQYIVTATLKDVNDGVISTATIDLPLESVVVKATVSEEDGQKFLILTLQSGEETKIPLEDIFQGLATKDWVNAQISVVNTTINGIGTRVTALENGLETAETDISTLKEDMSAAETEIDELKRSKLDSKGLTHSSDGVNTSFGVGDGVVIHSRQSDGEIVIQGYETNASDLDISYFTSITARSIAGIPYDDIASKTEATILKKRVDNIEGVAIDFVIDSTDAVTKTVPTDALPYAKIMKIGGKTYVEDTPDGFILKSAPVTELTSYASDGELLDTFTVPEVVRPVNGINANACDYIAWEADGTRKKYVCIAIVDASSLTWYYDSSTNVFYTASLNNEKATGSTNVLCTRYDTATVSWANMGDKMIAGASGDSVLRIKDTEYGSDLTSFRNSLAGVQIAYEMKTPTVTDISNILTPDNYIEVGGGGTITAVNGGKGAPTTIYYATEKTGG